jgi:hypothetical protein
LRGHHVTRGGGASPPEAAIKKSLDILRENNKNLSPINSSAVYLKD